MHDPSKYAGSNSDVLVMASNGHYSQHVPRIKPDHILYAGSDFLHPVWFCFSKEGPDHIVQNWPGSNLDGLVWVWQNTSGLAASWCARIIGPGSGRTELARYQFPTFRLGYILPQTALWHDLSGDWAKSKMFLGNSKWLSSVSSVNILWRKVRGLQVVLHTKWTV